MENQQNHIQWSIRQEEPRHSPRQKAAPADSLPTYRPSLRISRLLWIVLASTLSIQAIQAQSVAGKIMPLGDSITYGFNGLNHPNGSIPGGYRKQLGSRLSAAGFSYDFVGGSKANSAAGMDPDHNGFNGFRTDQILAKLPAWLAAAPDIVLMHLGTNDLIQHVPLNTLSNNLNSLIQQITDNAPNRKLFVATIIPIIDSRDGYTAAQWAGVIGSYNIQLRGIVQRHAAQGRKVMLMELNANLAYTAANPLNNFFQPGDGTHPGQAGYNQMGDFWFEAIKSAAIPQAASTNLLINGSFESNYSGWIKSGNQSIQPTAPNAKTSGAKLVNFNGGNLAPTGTLIQTFQTRPGTPYTVTFDAGVIAYNNKTQTLHVAVVGASARLSQSIPLSGTGTGTTRWTARSFTFVADSTSSTLVFSDHSTSSNALDLLLDNIRVTANASASPIESAGLRADIGSLSVSGIPGDITISMTATANGLYILEYSGDMSHWERIGEIQVADPGPIIFRDERAATKTGMFYRVGIPSKSSAP